MIILLSLGIIPFFWGRFVFAMEPLPEPDDIALRFLANREVPEDAGTLTEEETGREPDKQQRKKNSSTD